MLLSDEKKSEIHAQWLTRSIGIDSVIEIIEAAILAKLASAELLPVQDLSDEEKQFIHCNPDTDDLVELIQGHAAAYGRQAYAQGFAAGAAAQLAEMPKCWAIFTEDGNARMWSTFQPHVQKLADAEGLAVTELYTRREAK